MIYAINYDLKKPGQDYSNLYKAIESLGSSWHYLRSTWLVDTTLTADAIRDRLAPHVDQNDRMLIIGVTHEYSGWLTKSAWEWINQRYMGVRYM